MSAKTIKAAYYGCLRIAHPRAGRLRKYGWRETRSSGKRGYRRRHGRHGSRQHEPFRIGRGSGRVEGSGQSCLCGRDPSDHRIRPHARNEGAKATIVGAYDTTVYTISYTPTNGGPEVKDHKWVIHEELKDAGKEPLKPGAKAGVNADHMEGMNGATAVIDSAEQTTVYMVDFTSTSGEEVKNHKWVTESELSPVQ